MYVYKSITVISTYFLAGVVAIFLKSNVMLLSVAVVLL